MILYTPVTGGAETADVLARLMWQLARGVSLPADVTAGVFGIITATDGSSWLQVDTAFQMRIHPEAELGGIGPILLGAGLAAADVEALAAEIVAARGAEVAPWTLFPAVFQTASRTHDQMLQAGLFNPVTLP